MIFVIEDVFKIDGKGNVATGKVVNESISAGEILKLSDANGVEIQEVTVNNLEKFRIDIQVAEVGDYIGICLDGDLVIEQGMTLSKLTTNNRPQTCSGCGASYPTGNFCEYCGKSVSK